MANKIKNYILFHYHFDKQAGTERVLYNIMEYLCKDENNNVLLLIIGKKNDLVFGVDKLPVKIKYLDVELKESTSKFRILSYYFSIFVSVFNFFKNSRITEKTAILTTNVFLAYILYCVKKYLSINKLDVISCEHFAFQVTGRVSRFIRSLFYKEINVVMLTQKDTEFIDRRYHPKVCECIPNALPFEPQPYNKNNNKVIIAIGRYTYQKGFDLLIQSFALISNKFSDWTLKIIGDDFGDKTLMERLIQDKRIDNILLTPSTDRIQDYYAEASFFVMSSRFEGLPMVLIEAMGYGLPIVSYDCPTGPSEVVDDINGFLVQNGNVRLLADAMDQLMSNPELLLQKSEGSEAMIKSFLKAEINEKWEVLFDKI